MISLILNRSAAHQEESVRLKLPATPGEIGEAYKALDLLDGGPIAIFDAECSIPNLRSYIIYSEFNDQESFEQLQELAQRIARMSRKEQMLFSGAIENESIHSLADILSISEHLDRYVLLPHIDSDAALGRFLVDSGFKDCPEDMQAYLNYDAIGRDYRSEYGGAFGYGGFVRQKETADLMPDVDAIGLNGGSDEIDLLNRRIDALNKRMLSMVNEAILKYTDLPKAHIVGQEVRNMLSAWLMLILSGSFFSLRLSGGGSFPRPLKAEEEKECLERMAQGDMEARDQLIEHNLRLVAHIIKKYYTQDRDQDDLISIGTIGLIKGISTFKPDKNVRLATYASRCIENEILMYFRSSRKLQGEVSLSDSLDTDQEGNALSLMDVISVDDTMLEDLDAKESRLRVRKCIAACLTEREADIIRMRFGLNGADPLTQREIAAKYGISRSYVSRRR